MARHTDETVDLLNAASAPRASASVASTSRVDNPRTNPAITSDSNAFDRVMPLPNSREQNCSVVPRSFAQLNGSRPGGGLDRARAVAVAAADPRIRAVRRALVASATEELAGLRPPPRPG